MGFTQMWVKERFRIHVQKATKGYKHPLAAAIRKYGKENFIIEVLATFTGIKEALDYEAKVIGETPNAYNVSPGGEGDGAKGAERMREMLKDPVFRKKYSENLSKAVRASEKHRRSWLKIKERTLKWRKENPKKAYYSSRRAFRIATKKLWGETRKKKKYPKYANRLESIKRRKAAVKLVWATRTKQQKEELAKKISKSIKKLHDLKSDTEKLENRKQLAKAREKIDHDIRKKNQKKALEEYWTPERRKEKSEASRKIQNARKDL